MSEAAMDMVADDATVIQRNLQKVKWDRKKKKFVSMQSVMDQAKKIKTESGSYIKASYKKDLYSKWLKNHKALDREDRGDEDADADGDERNNRKNKKFFGSSRIGNIG